MTEFTQGIQGAFKKLWEAGAVALIEPSINGVWFYVLHKTYKKIKGYE